MTTVPDGKRDWRLKGWLFERVEGSGARIDEKPTERPYGSREFTCRDPEGNVWCFGTYWPKVTDAV